MAPVYCPCGFENVDLHRFSADWCREHRDHHLATYPDVDRITRDNLAMFIDIAERREQAS